MKLKQRKALAVSLSHSHTQARTLGL